MLEVQLKLNDQRHGAFVIEQNGSRLAEMVIGIKGDKLTVYHTEVNEALKGKGVAGKLLESMTTYARKNHFKVIPLCAYVLAQFKRHPEHYDDLWAKD